MWIETFQLKGKDCQAESKGNIQLYTVYRRHSLDSKIQFSVKEQNKIYLVNSKHKKGELLTVLISGKIDFRTKMLVKINRDIFLWHESIHMEDVKIINI